MFALNPEQLDSEFFRLFFSISLDLFCIADLDFNIIALTRAWSSHFGYTEEELVGIRWVDFVHPEELTRSLGANEQLRSGQDVVSFENRFRAKNGQYRNLLLNCRKHPTKDYVFCVATDITEQKQREDQLKKEKDEVLRFLSEVPGIAAIFNGSECVFEFANNEYIEMIGGRDPVGMKLGEVIPYMGTRLEESIRKVFKTGQRVQEQDAEVKADWHGSGKIESRYFNFVLSPLKNNSGRVDAFWCLAYDVTDLKLMRCRLLMSEKMASLGTLAAGIAHEINNPLAYSMNMIESLSRRLQKADEKNFSKEKFVLEGKAHECQQGLERIRKIVQSLKSFSRNDTEILSPVSAAQVIQSSLKLVENEIKYRAKVLIDIESVPMVLAEEGKLCQVLTNLLANAAQSIEPGNADHNIISIRVRNCQNGQVEIQVSDTGCGIDPSLHQKIFEPFYTSKPASEGTGLGLSICSGIINAFNGSLTFDSQVGKGSVFTVRLPIATETSNPNLSNQEAVANPAVSACRSRLLLVDDEKDLADSIAELLEDQYDITVANSVGQALEVLNSQDFDVILCDVMMPKKSGFDFYDELQSQGSGLHQKVIFMTGGVLAQKTDRTPQVIHRQISKPFTPEELFEVLRSNKMV